jgi:hypothetical protein
MFLRTFFVSFLNDALLQKKMTELTIEFNITNSKHHGVAIKYVEADNLPHMPAKTTIAGV